MSDSVWLHRWQPTRLPIPGILEARTLEWVAISLSESEVAQPCPTLWGKMLPHKDLTKCPRELSVLSTLMYVLCTQHVLECLMCNLHCFLKICVWRIPLLNYRHFEFNCDLCFLRQLYVVTWKTTVDSSPTSTPETWDEWNRFQCPVNGP